MKYRDAYEYGKTTLEKASVPSFATDARLLLEFCCKTETSMLFSHPDYKLSDREKDEYKHSIELRAQRIPLQHITKQQEFMGLNFVVNQDVLIPRQDTEFVVEQCLESVEQGMNILDMCTGSGCIILSLLHYTKDCSGVGADISTKALDVARKNASICREENVKFIQSDLFEKLPNHEKYDIIISNPPYIETTEISKLESEVMNHDPFIALDGKEDGLYFYRKIIAIAPHYLKEGGKLFLEIGYQQADAIIKLMANAGFENIIRKKDYAGLDRMVTGTRTEGNYV